MYVVAIASQKGGAGKSTFAVNLATLADREHTPALLIDTDTQGSLTVWHRARESRTPLLVTSSASNLDEVLATAQQHNAIEWVFIDGPPQANEEVAAIMRAATLVLIPTRPGVFDLASLPATIAIARRTRKPFFVALNAVPPKRGIAESPIVLAARKAVKDMGAPVWRGAIAQRAVYSHALASGQAVTEFESSGPASDEIKLLWRDVSEAARAMAQHESAHRKDVS
jgi:chromosome partitioning protein